MTAIGWTTDTQADNFFSTRIGLMEFWLSLTTNERIAALTTAYDQMRFSRQLSIPSNPSPAQLEKLQYAQHELSAILALLSEGGIRREAVISQGVVSAGIVQESYQYEETGKLPPRITSVLYDFNTEKGFYQYDLYRDETKNPAFDRAYPS